MQRSVTCSAWRYFRARWICSLSLCSLVISGKVLEKSQVISLIRQTLRNAGVTTARQDEVRNLVERFGGHVLRVAGTQHLYLLGLRWDLVQLHGRWSSLAVQRYLQEAPLIQVPGVVSQALSSGPQVRPEEPSLIPDRAQEAELTSDGQLQAVSSCAPPLQGGGEEPGGSGHWRS